MHRFGPGFCFCSISHVILTNNDPLLETWLLACAPETLNHEKQHYGNGMSALRWWELINEQHKAQENERNRQMVLYRHDVTLGHGGQLQRGSSKVTIDSPHTSHTTAQQTLI